VKRSNLAYVDPGTIMGLVVTLLVLMVGVFAFSAVLDEVNEQVEQEEAEQQTEEAIEELDEVETEMIDLNPIINLFGVILVFLGVFGIIYFIITGRKKYLENQKRALRKKKLRERYVQSLSNKAKKDLPEYVHIKEYEIEKLPSEPSRQKTKTKGFEEWGKSKKKKGGDFNI
jgi:hypothetical protein